MIEKIVSELPQRSTTDWALEIVDERLAQGDLAFCADLGIAIAAAQAASADPIGLWQYSTVFDRLFRVLSMTPGIESVAQVSRLVTTAGRAQRETASMLASCQSPADLAPALTSVGEVRACLVHELVLRGVAVDGPLPSGHPLAWLPLTRSALESQADLPKYSATGSSWSMPFTEEPGEPVSATGHRGSSAVETAVDVERMGAAVVKWGDESNGQREARTFMLLEPVESLPDTLLGLGPACLNEARPTFWTAAIDPSWAWRALFSAAATGGAYTSGMQGAYGRLAAWRSLGALADSPVDANAEEVEARVRECGWHRFDTGTAWFENVVWDLGLVAVSPEGRLAVLAATDTD